MDFDDVEFEEPEVRRAVEFLRQFELATRPQINGEPVLRYGLLHPDRGEIVHVQVKGVPDAIMDEYYEQAPEDQADLDEFVEKHGGVVERVPSVAVMLAMTKGEGVYRIYELDTEGAPTGIEFSYDSLHVALRSAAFGYGFGTMTWREMAGNKDPG